MTEAKPSEEPSAGSSEKMSQHVPTQCPMWKKDDRNLTAVGSGTEVSVWRRQCDKVREDEEKAQSPYFG